MIKELVKNSIYPLIKSPPDFLIIGAQKAGTTSLYEYLTKHPQVVGNKGWKEVRYFDLPENHDKGFAWYLSNFPSKLEKGHRLTFDASPSYLYFPHIPQLIKQELGNIKMIAILRNPVDRAYSAWQMYHSFFDNSHQHLKEIADERTFTQAVEDELAGKTASYPYDYVNRGKYAQQLENYYKYFDCSNILVLNSNQMRKDIALTLQTVNSFLNIEPFSQELLQKMQQEKFNVGKYQQKSSDDLKTIEWLKSYFEPFNQELYRLIGENYSW
jgi:hypothetical protein